MAKHIVARVADIPRDTRKLVHVAGRPIVIFNVKDEYFAVFNRCPHQGADLCHGVLTGLAAADGVGSPTMTHMGEILVCSRHGWEFDLRTGQSWFDPARTKVRMFASEIASGSEVVRGPYKAETFKIEVDEDYLVITM
jgi:nitrite reductase/ring-hydroxylating ferredoxin subunit